MAAQDTSGSGVIDALVIASWFPTFDDPIAGRFVADQVAAVAASGRVRPAVVSFEPAQLVGSGRMRDRLAATVSELGQSAIRSRPEVFTPGGLDLPFRVPVARLVVPNGRYPAAGTLHGAVARDAALTALGDRWLMDEPVAGHGLGARRPALIHAHTGYPDGAAGAMLASRLGCPLVITEHASFVGRLVADPAIRRRYADAIAMASRLVIVSRTLAAELIELMPEVESKVVVIPNAIDVEAFRLSSGPAGPGAELLFVGYRKPSKGIETLLRAFARVHQGRPKLTLRLVGRSPTSEIEDQWRRIAGELGVADAVVLDGPADRAGVADALARASLFVHPSPRETFGVVAAEALAAGVPVVAADSGGVTEILGDHPDSVGAIVPPDDPEALAQGIERTLARLGSFDRSALRASVSARFGAPGVAAQLVNLYEDVLAAARAEARAPEPSRANGIGPRGGASQEPIRVVVAFDPERLETVARLPATLRSRLVVVTSRPAHLPDGFAGVVVTDLDARVRAMASAAILGPPVHGFRRVLRAARHPFAFARRRGLLPGFERMLSTRGAAAVNDGLRGARTAAGSTGPIEVVCVDGVDHFAAAALVRGGHAWPAPGGLQWLGDRGSLSNAPGHSGQ